MRSHPDLSTTSLAVYLDSLTIELDARWTKRRMAESQKGENRCRLDWIFILPFRPWFEGWKWRYWFEDRRFHGCESPLMFRNHRFDHSCRLGYRWDSVGQEHQSWNLSMDTMFRRNLSIDLLLEHENQRMFLGSSVDQYWHTLQDRRQHS